MTEKTINYIKLPDGETYRVGGGSGFNLFDTKVSDHVLEGDEALGWALQGTYVYKEGVAGSRTGYADFYNRCLEEKENSTATETTLGDNTITMYVNANGHKFYDIADKTVVDNWYNTYGIADYYGIDLVNERIFLPRNDYFVQLTGDTSKVNEMIEAGLPDHRHDIGFSDYGGSAYGTVTISTSHKQSGFGNASVSTASALTSLASKDNSIYGNSDTIQPPSSLKLLYYCVGNTKAEPALSNVTEITTSENDTLPLFHNFYSKEDMTTTGAYVNASLGSWLSGNVYPTAYEELVNKLGTDNVKANTDTYTDYDFVVNQDDMTFRLPLLNGERVLVEKKEATTDDPTWYNLYSDGWLEQGGTNTVTGAKTVTYPKSYNDTSYSLVVTLPFNGESSVTSHVNSTKTNNSFSTVGGSQNGAWWQAEGYIDIPTKTDINLYYKVANAVTNLELLDVAKVTADLNTKISKTECPAYIVETYQNGTSWYRVYSDGWCEQGGYSAGASGGATINLLKQFKDVYYSVSYMPFHTTSTDNASYIQIKNKTNSTFFARTISSSGNITIPFTWQASGYIA